MKKIYASFFAFFTTWTFCSAANFSVTVTNDNGAGSLRQAILDANASVGTDTITFSIGSGQQTIGITSTLPDITETVTVDGTTQPGYVDSPIVEMSGQFLGTSRDGLRITASQCVIRGLVINRFTGDGIEIAGGTSSNRVEGCVIGLNVAGTADLGNSLNGILLTNSGNNVIGGTNSAARNIIGGNSQSGIHILGNLASGNTVLGNYLGLGRTNASVGNSGNGVLLAAPSNTIGGTNAGAANFISGNSSDGIEINGANASNNVVEGNFIGTDATGLLDRGNSSDGIFITSAAGNRIGGTSANQRNVISGNTSDGVELSGTAAAFNIVRGNFIGTDVSGTAPIANSVNGVLISANARTNYVGGILSGEGNRVAFNLQDGISLGAGTNNVLRGNSVYLNGSQGIDLGTSGVTTNDPGDFDPGANQQQNFPMLTAATNTQTGLHIFGNLNSRPNTLFEIDFYSSLACDPTGHGEGQRYLGSTTASTDSSSNVTFSVVLATNLYGRFVTATATDPFGNTSEFSPCLPAQSTLTPITATVLNTNDSGAGSLRQAMANLVGIVSSANNTVNFNIPGSGPHMISPLSALDVPDRVTIDGFTQTNASANTLSNGNNAVLQIRLDGLSAGSGVNGLRLQDDGCVIRGLSITRFNGSGLEIATNGNHAVEGCFIGLDTTGTTALPNGSQGININKSPGNRIGGTSPAARNVISGNNNNGIRLTGVESQGNMIQGNFIGTDGTGLLSRQNGNDGININNAPSNTIGGSAEGAGNFISGNLGDGVDINGTTATNNMIFGNWIGLDATGSGALPNISQGVLTASTARFNLIGATNAGAGNRIAFNSNQGVWINGGTNNTVRGNNIFSNLNSGLVLDNGSFRTNDIGDGDTGANQLQNFPVITSGTIHVGSTLISGTLSSGTNRAYHIDFFSSHACDPTGYGEGQQYLGSTTITTDSSGNGAFNVTLSITALGRYLTATATDTNGNTSPFSQCFTAVSTFAPVTFTVTNTNNAGPDSLRQVLLQNNVTPSGSPNRIVFNIPGSDVRVISPTNALPVIVESVFIDGYSQPGSSTNTAASGFNGALKIRLRGISIPLGRGLQFASASNEVRGLLFTSWTEALVLSNGWNKIAGNWVGLNENGTNLSLTTSGITIYGGRGTQIGGTALADRNIISGNSGFGVDIFSTASETLVHGNYIGTDPTGMTDRRNSTGVRILGSSSNVISANLISGNSSGVMIDSGTNNVVKGNRIGVNATGIAALPNLLLGVDILNSANGNLIGGATPGDGNVISANQVGGLNLTAGATNNVIEGNFIGTDASGTVLLGNVNNGVYLSGASGNRIGGTNSGAGNIIANSVISGVKIQATGTNNTIRGNSIFDNGAIGINLSTLIDEVSTNDLGDADSGPNQLQNFPQISSAVFTASSGTIIGTLNSQPNRTYEIDFYANTFCDGSGNGEGKFYLGSASVTTDGSGNASINAAISQTAPATFITATATDPFGNTSEFSPCVEAVIDIPAGTFTVTTTNDSGAGSLRQAILDSNAHLSTSNNLVAFNIPGSGVRSIQLLSALPAFSQPATIDGFTQPGASVNTLAEGNNANWLVELNGAAAAAGTDGLRLNVEGMKVRGLRITRFTDGVEISISNCVVEGSFTFSNSNAGIRITNGVNNLIGGTNASARNVISANANVGVGVYGTNSRNNSVLGNFIGTDASGGSGLASLVSGGKTATASASGPSGQFIGIENVSASNNRYGGIESGAGNRIAHNDNTGIRISSGVNNVARGNRIYQNGGMTIDLDFLGRSPNDTGDGDTGANFVQNFPDVTTAVGNAGSTLVQGSFNSQAGTQYMLDFYNGNCGSAEFYLGSGAVTTDELGNATFSFTFLQTLQRQFVMATATSPASDTSELSECLSAATVSLPPSTNVVSNTNDSGPGSLRQAIMDVSIVTNTGADVIQFNIPGAGPHVIQPTTQLPVPTQPVVIDGFTQPGAAPNTSSNANNAVYQIQIDGAMQPTGSGIMLTQSGSTIRGLSLTRFPAGAVNLSGAGGSVVEGNLIGVKPDGTAAGNNIYGVTIGSAGNLIGGAARAAQNVISANAGTGVLISGTAASANMIQGNLIGSDKSGTNAMGNLSSGVFVQNAAGAKIGGTNASAGNVIVANGGPGVDISGSNATNNQVEANFIGRPRGILKNLGNAQAGVRTVNSASFNTIGGREEGKGNFIIFNSGAGVAIDSGRQNGIFGNKNRFNTGKAIALAVGANDNVKPPILRFAARGSVIIAGEIVGQQPNTTYEIEVTALVFRSPDPSDFDDIIVGRITVTTDSNGNAHYQETIETDLPADEDVFTIGLEATTTLQNSTSERSHDVPLSRLTDANLRTKIEAFDADSRVGTDTLIIVTVSNDGPANADNLLVETVLPPGSTIVTSTNLFGTIEYENGTVNFNLGSVPAGEQRSVSSTVFLNHPGLTEARAKATAQNRDPVPENNSARVGMSGIPGVTNADIAVTISTSFISGPVSSPISYTVTIHNNGPSNASNVRLVHDASALHELTGASTSAGTLTFDPNIDPNRAVVTLPSLLAGQSATLTVTGKMIGSVLSDQNIRSMSASGSADQDDPNPFNNTAYASVEAIGQPPVLEIRRTAGNNLIKIVWVANNAYRLETITELNSPQFVPVPPEQIETSAGESSYILPFTDISAFYRLKLVNTSPVFDLSQLSASLDNNIFYPFSGWGVVNVDYQASAVPLYLNVSVDGTWTAQNVPLPSIGGPGVPQQQKVLLPLGSFGTRLENANVGFSLGPTAAPAMPPSTQQVNINLDFILHRSGITGEVSVFLPPKPIIANTVVAQAKGLRGFPNREQGENECCPSAVLNSLNYLKANFPNLSTSLTSSVLNIDTIKQATLWTTQGSPGNWSYEKNHFMQDNSLPIITERTTNMTQVIAAVAAGHDVEIDLTGHVACVSGVADLGGGRYALTISHDVMQGQAGGLWRQSVIYDRNTGKLDGLGFSGDKLDEFVIERPAP